MRKDLLLKPGLKFGKWTTIEWCPKSEIIKIGKWRCICDCGFEKLIKTNDLIDKHTTMCQTCSNRIVTYNRRLPKGQACIREILTRIKRQATTRNIPMSLSNEEILNLVFDKCFYCNSGHSNKVISHLGEYMTFNGIDRMNNTKGYTIQNSVTCCKVCNISKSILSTKEWLNNMEKILINKEKILERSETISKESTFK